MSISEDFIPVPVPVGLLARFDGGDWTRPVAMAIYKNSEGETGLAAFDLNGYREIASAESVDLVLKWADA